MSTVTDVATYYPKLIREFIVNLHADLNESRALEFHKVHVHGKCFDVSSALLNSFLKHFLPIGFLVNLPAPEQLPLELSGGMVRVWPTDGQFPTIKLSVKYVILHKVGIAN